MFNKSVYIVIGIFWVGIGSLFAVCGLWGPILVLSFAFGSFILLTLLDDWLDRRQRRNSFRCKLK